MTVVYTKYFDEIHRLMRAVEETQGPQIETAAQVMADVIANDGVIHIFGPGHMHIMAEEMTWRAGGLVAISPILDPDVMPFFGPQVGLIENLEGYGVIVFETFETKPGEAIIIVSQAGRCAVAIDIALAAKRKELTVIAITGVEYTQSFDEPWHSSGKRLMEVADIVIDNYSPVGEASVRLEGLPQPIGAVTTVLTAYILNAINVQVAQNLLERGITPPVGWSANVEMPDEMRPQFQAMVNKYRDRIARRRRPTQPLAKLLEISKGFTAKNV